MKILFINLPYHGHVIPTIGLTQELIKAGHQVTYLMPYDWADKLNDSGADFHRTGYQQGTDAAISLLRRSYGYLPFFADRNSLDHGCN